MNPDLICNRRFEYTILALCALHLVLDWMKLRIISAGYPDNAKIFFLDQLLHLVTVIAATIFIIQPPLKALIPYLREIRAAQDKILLVALVYVLVVFASGYFIRYLLGPLWKDGDTSEESRTHHDEVVNAGLYIGWLERFLALTAIFLQSPSTVGLILTAKSIARYPELKNPGQFVEYFLIGTLLSISTAIAGGIVLLKILYGTVALSK